MSRPLTATFYYNKIGDEKMKKNIICCFCGDTESVRYGKFEGKIYCNKHHLHMIRYGKVSEKTLKDKNDIILYETYAEIVLRNINKDIVAVTIIDIDDLEKATNYKWHLNKTKLYASSINTKSIINNFNKKILMLHQLIMSDYEILKGYEIDHINRNRLDNRKCNLRIVTHQENLKNRKRQV